MDREERLRRHKIASRKYYLKNLEKIKKYREEYRQTNKEKISEYGFKLRARPETQERLKRWREENKEYTKKINAEWREENKEHKNQKDREYQRRITRDPILRKKRLEYQKKIREKNKERITEYNQRYHNSDKGKIKYTRHNHLRLSKKFGNEFNLSAKEVREIKERDKVCVYCGSDNRLELDHIIPISKNGKSVYSNFVMACRSCNPSKTNKDVFVWCKEQGIEVPKIVTELLNRQNQGV